MRMDKTDAQERLGPLPSLIYRAVEYGVEKAKTYSLHEKISLSPWCFGNLVRSQALSYLEKHNQLGFELYRLPLDGIEIRYNGCRIRHWKANEDGELPPPRGSQTKLEYYQQELFPLSAYGPDALLLKLVALWELDEHQNLSSVKLVCPSGSDDNWEPSQIHWSIDIPHPATDLSGPPEFGAPDKDIDDLEGPGFGTKEQ